MNLIINIGNFNESAIRYKVLTHLFCVLYNTRWNWIVFIVLCLLRDDHAEFDGRDKNISLRKIAKNREKKNNNEKENAIESRVLRSTTVYVILFCNAFAAGYLKRVIPHPILQNKVSTAIRQPILESVYYFKPNKPTYCSTCIALALMQSSPS